jgi:hypothetical protein
VKSAPLFSLNLHFHGFICFLLLPCESYILTVQHYG